MTRLLCLVCVLALAGCEIVTNTGRVCLRPQNVQCNCDSLDDTFSCGPPTGDERDDIWCRGTYPADGHYQIDAWLFRGGHGYSVNERCKVKIEDHRIEVRGSFQHEPEQDAIVEPPAYATCEVGTLAAGTWTLVYGGNEATIEIGGTDVEQDMLCVESDKQHTD